VATVWRIVPAGDAAVLVTVSEAIDPHALGQVLALRAALIERGLNGLRPPVPAYGSLLCPIDPGALVMADLESVIREIEPSITPTVPVGQLVEVPVQYDGPDLARVAEHSGLDPARVIEAHASSDYLVYAIGFAPGFTYCGQLPNELATPRLPSPRAVVPAGSVGIAGRQTGIYAVESPGGWNLVGRTEFTLFDPAGDPPIRIKVGDRVRFRPLG
jgi:inhibitor of KinA